MKNLILIGKGREAEVYSFKPGWVVKLFFTKGQYPVAFEERVHQRLLKLGLPVTKSNGVIEIEKRVGIIMEHHPGKSMLHELTNKPWKLISLAKDLAKLHTQIHKERMDDIPNDKDRIRKRFSNMKFADEKIKIKAIQLLDSSKNGNRICHGDFHPDNVLIGNSGNAVIDWTNISYGNPLSDVARTSLILRLGDSPPGTPLIMNLMIGIGRRVFHSAYLSQYFKLNSEYSKKELGHWFLPMAIDRLSENIPSEREALLRIINTYDE